MTITVISWLAGAQGFAILFAAVFCILEISSMTASKKFIVHPTKLWRAVLIWIAAIAMFICFLIPPFYIGLNGSTGLLVAALLWLLGGLFYIANSYGMVPIFNWTLLVIAFSGTTSFITISSTAPRTATNAPDYALTLAMLIITLAAAFFTVRRQTAMMSQLATARDAAQSQMAKLEHLTNHDFLTGLTTRRAFDDQVNDMLHQKAFVTVLLIDLDSFKPINDSYSHAAGDMVLRVISRRLQRLVGDIGTVARLGGDEFAIATTLWPDAEHATRYANKVAEIICKPIRFEQRRLIVTASIGIAQESCPTTLQQLMMHADQAMYAAKEGNGKSHCHYDVETFPNRATLDDRAMLLAALEDGEIAPYYQPKIDLQTNQIIGMEALARWTHPVYGFMLPGEFLPQINALGLQSDFLMHTLKRTLDDISDLIQNGIAPGAVSVNLPEITLATDTGRDALLTILGDHPAVLPYLTFEVTEDIFIARSATMIQKSIQQFRRMGVRVSLDDFGTGFASFANLRELEFDELKLDTGFVQALGTDPAAKVLIKAFLDIGIGLNVEIIAEGVETTQQRDALKNMGCRWAQGFLFSKAIPFTEIRDRLRVDQNIGLQKPNAA